MPRARRARIAAGDRGPASEATLSATERIAPSQPAGPNGPADRAFGRLVDGLNAAGGLRVTFATDGLTGRLPPETELALYRVAQEALTNVAKHAHASKVKVALTVTRKALSKRLG